LPEFTLRLIHSVEDHAPEIEKTLQEVLEHWTLDRVGIVERALLKLACAEIDYFADIPPRVTINEYLELAKRYSNENAPGFLNGVLDRLVHLRQKPDVHVEKVKRRAGQS
jgi:N utilization substance protein B